MKRKPTIRHSRIKNILIATLLAMGAWALAAGSNSLVLSPTTEGGGITVAGGTNSVSVTASCQGSNVTGTTTFSWTGATPDNPGSSGAKVFGGAAGTSSTVTVVGTHIYQVNGQSYTNFGQTNLVVYYVGVSNIVGPTNVLAGTSTNYTAQPLGGTFPTAQPVWSGTNGASVSGSGPSATADFSTNPGTATIQAVCGTSTNNLDVNVILVKILKPRGSLGSNSNTASAWLASPCYHFDFQGVVSSSPNPYPLILEGVVEPIPPFGRKWTLPSGAGTLTGDTSTTPAYSSPSGEGQGQLVLKAMIGSADTGLKDTKMIKIYKDHLARDRENFGVGVSCWNNWSFAAHGVTISMGGTWNCHGSVHHAYDGSGTGYSASTVGWQTTEYLPPINWSALRSSLTRGDVVSFYSGTPGGYVLQHSHTSLGEAVMYGANNEASVNFLSSIPATWKWGECTSQQYFNAVNAGSQAVWGTDLLVRVVVHKKP